jgi:hypothetical protein
VQITPTITVIVTPIVQSIVLSNNSVTTSGPNNAGVTVGTLSITANPPGQAYTGTISLSGVDGPKFAF